VSLGSPRVLGAIRLAFRTPELRDTAASLPALPANPRKLTEERQGLAPKRLARRETSLATEAAEET